MQQTHSRVPGIFFSIFSRRDLSTTLSNPNLQVFPSHSRSVEVEILRLGMDRVDSTLRTTAAYLFIYYLLRWQDVREVLDEVPQGRDTTEEFSVKTVPGLRRSCVDWGDFLSLEPPSESSLCPFQACLRGNEGLLFSTHFHLDEQSWCSHTHTPALSLLLKAQPGAAPSAQGV